MDQSLNRGQRPGIILLFLQQRGHRIVGFGGSRIELGRPSIQADRLIRVAQGIRIIGKRHQVSRIPLSLQGHRLPQIVQALLIPARLMRPLYDGIIAPPAQFHLFLAMLQRLKRQVHLTSLLIRQRQLKIRRPVVDQQLGRVLVLVHLRILDAPVLIHLEQVMAGPLRIKLVFPLRLN